MTRMLANKTALVTGGGSGIGKSLCLRLAREGAALVVVDIDERTAMATCDEIAALGGQADARQCDLADNAQVAEVFGPVVDTRAVDILVNSAGIAHIGTLEKTGESDLDRLYQVNIKGVYHAMLAVIGGMKARRSGVIINLASVAASAGIAERFAYSMTKGAVVAMTYSVARDYIDAGIRCNCVSPARIHTPFVDGFLERHYPDNKAEMFARLANSQPIGRMGKADEVAGLIAYLCSDDAAFITGSNIPIDGGFITLNS